MPADSEFAGAGAGRIPAVVGDGRRLARPAFGDDDGSPDAQLRRALAHGDPVECLAEARLLVAVVAVADERTVEGGDKDSHMAVVSMVNAAGERGLLAFTGLDALRKWDVQARPVPVRGADAARSALQDGADALVIDVLGPHRVVVSGPQLRALARLDDDR